MRGIMVSEICATASALMTGSPQSPTLPPAAISESATLAMDEPRIRTICRAVSVSTDPSAWRPWSWSSPNSCTAWMSRSVKPGSPSAMVGKPRARKKRSSSSGVTPVRSATSARE